MKLITRIQLSIMMFLQFIIWGAWYGQLSKYLIAINFDGGQIGDLFHFFNGDDRLAVYCWNDCRQILSLLKKFGGCDLTWLR